MRFQVLDSTVGLTDSSRWLKFRIVLCGHGELSISDGSRVAAVDLEEKWGQQLKLGDIQGDKLPDLPAGDLNDVQKSIGINLHISDNKFDGYQKFVGSGPPFQREIKKFLDDDNICGFAEYINGDDSFERRHCIEIVLFAGKDRFDEIMEIQNLPPAPTYFNISIEGLEEPIFSDLVPWVSAKWDLTDETYSGLGNLRPVLRFSYERCVPHFTPELPRRSDLEKWQVDNLNALKSMNSKIDIMNELIRNIFDARTKDIILISAGLIFIFITLLFFK